MNIRRWIGTLAVAGLAVTTAACSGPDSDAQEASTKGEDKSPITIGVLIPMSGAMATTTAGYQAVAKAIGTAKLPGTETIDGREVKIVMRDDQSSAAGTASAMRQLLDSDHIDALIGPLYTAQAQAALPLVKQAGILEISLSGCPDCGDGTKYPTTFSVEADRPSQMKSTIDHMEKVGVQKVAMLQSDDPTGQAYADAFTAAAKERGIQIVKTVHFAMGALDLGTQAAQLQATGADGVYLASAIVTDVANVAKAFREIRYQPYMFGNASAAVSVVAQAIGPEWAPKWAGSGFGRNATRPNPAPQAAEFSTWIGENIGEKGLASPINLWAGILDGFHLIKNAIEGTHSTDGETLAEWLEEHGYEDGVKAPYEFTDADHNGMNAEFQAVIQPGTLEAGIPLRAGESD